MCRGLNDELEELGRGSRSTKVLPSPPPRPLGAWLTELGGDQRCDQQAAQRSTWLENLRMGFLAWSVEMTIN